MTLMVLGLVLFLGVHSVRIVAPGWRDAQFAKLGEGKWKGMYSLVSLAGFVLILWGYAAARPESATLWNPPVWTRHTAALLMVLSFVLLAAAYVPGTRLKAAVKHPMVLAVKVWAFAHLISNGRVAEIVLFGAFLVWAVLDFRSSRGRDRANRVVYPAGTLSRDGIALVIGIVVWLVFVRWLHAAWIGVAPLG